MRITSINVYRQNQPFAAGEYRCRNQTEYGFDSTIVAINTDAGVTGWGEVAPLGSFYSEAFAAGIRAGIRQLAPLLIGEDPRQISRIVNTLDSAMMGQMDVKTALDMACWDIAAQSAGQPLAAYLGGRFATSVPLYRSVSQAEAKTMLQTARQYVADGYRRLQIKVGGDPVEDAQRVSEIIESLPGDITFYCDANGAWDSQAALQFLRLTTHCDYILEQPCATYEACRRVRSHCDHPLVLDESVDSLERLMQIHREDAADGITIKLSRFGGITRSHFIRNLAVEMGLKVTVEDTGGAEIDTAAMTHMSLSTPDSSRTHTVDFHNWVTVSHGTGIPEVCNGEIAAPDGAGLGIEVNQEELGETLFRLT